MFLKTELKRFVLGLFAMTIVGATSAFACTAMVITDESGAAYIRFQSIILK